MQRAHGDAGSASKILCARDGSILLREPNQSIGERHCLRARGVEAPEERFHLGAYSIEIVGRRCARGSSSSSFDGHDTIDELTHDNPRERVKSGRRKLRPENLAAAQKLSDEALRRWAVHLEPTGSGRQVHAWVRQDLLREGRSPLEIPTHAPEAFDERHKIVGRRLASERKMLEPPEWVQNSDSALRAHRDIVPMWRTFAIREVEPKGNQPAEEE